MSKGKNLIEATPELKDKLRMLALTDFDKFLEMLHLDDVQIFICSEQLKGKSYQQIANRLSFHGFEMTRFGVRDRCKKCAD